MRDSVPRRSQQVDGIDSYAARQPFERAEGEVALTALYAAHVGAMHADAIRELLLAQPSLAAEGADVLAGDALKVTFHVTTIPDLLLVRLQTDE